MPELIECETHGECEQTYVCSHLVSDAVGLGFQNRTGRLTPMSYRKLVSARMFAS
jgi:hypothetical protein